MIDVSIIIVNYNTSALVNDAVASVFEKTEGISYEIIIVDNATENLSETITAAGHESVRLLQLDENVGFGRANNAGLQLARGRNVLFLNPDTVLLNNAVAILSRYLDENPACGACGGNLYDADMKPTRSFRRVYPTVESLVATTFVGRRYERWKSKGIISFNPTGKPLEVAYIVGADLMMRRKDLERYGSFSPDFFMYYEEIELCHRIHEAGFKVMSVPEAKIQHLEGKSGAMGTGKAAMHYRSSQTYFRKTLTEAGYARYRRALRFVIATRLMAGKLTGRRNMTVYWGEWKRLFNEDKD